MHAQARLKAGDITLTDLLAEERVLRDAEDANVRVHTATAIDLAALFKAPGGGDDQRIFSIELRCATRLFAADHVCVCLDMEVGG